MDIVFSSTTDLAAAIRTGQVSAIEVIEAHLAHIEQHNPALNAIITLDADGARQRAKDADVALAQGEVWGPLHGVPFTLKDAFATNGMRSTVGFPDFDHVPDDDSTIAARLKGAGGILMGKTNVPPMLADFQSHNPIFGRTNNPWNLERTPGGSSGGSAAAVASGMTSFDIGTDLSGSIRIPAHFCGIYGLKPTEHRVPLTGIFPLPYPSRRSVRHISCIGPLTRTVEDLRLVYSLIAGPDGRDTEVKPVPIEEIPSLTVKNLRVAIAPTFPGLPASEATQQAVRTLGQRLAEQKAMVEEVPLPESDLGEMLSSAVGLIETMMGAFQPAGDTPKPTVDDYLAVLDRRDHSIRAWEQFFGAWDVLVCPVAMTTAFPHCDSGSPLLVDDQVVDYWAISAHATVFSYTGHPAVVIPYTQDADGLPLGLQLVGKKWSESRLLAIANAISAVTGGFRRPT
jgi:amidase